MGLQKCQTKNMKIITYLKEKTFHINLGVICGLSMVCLCSPALTNSVLASEQVAEVGPGSYSNEYNIDNEGYIIINALDAEMLELVEATPAVNDPEVLAAEEAAEAAAEAIQSRPYYTVNDNGHTARLSNELQDWVYQMCAEYGIPGYEKLIISKLYCESGFNPNATHRNKNGTIDYGIAQINSSNHKWLRNTLGVNDFMDPYQSIRCGVYMMSKCLAENGHNESMALAAYNTGRNGISSTSYSRKVLGIKDTTFVG